MLGRLRTRSAACGVALLLAGSAQVNAQEHSTVAPLALEVERAQSVRDIAGLNDAYAQYSQFGMWGDMAGLFAEDSQFISGGDVVKGPKAILAYFRTHFGGGRDGLAPGGVATRLQFMPTINISADGQTGKGRWHELAFTGQYGVAAGFESAIEENDYVREHGVWKIKIFHAYPQFAGPYDKGWRNVEADLKIVPYHYTPETAGMPIPPATDTGVKDAPSDDIHQLSQKIQRMNDEDAVRNLQNMYGYYLDRKMWDDVTDLFAANGIYEPVGVGIYAGVPAIRKALEMNGPQGLKHGQVFDHVLSNETVSIMPGGQSARLRGLEFDMLGETATGTASMALSVFETRFVKINDVWRIEEIRVYPRMSTDYYQGWAKNRLPAPIPDAAHAPTRPTPAADMADGAVPEFFLSNPATQKEVAYPKGASVVGADPLVGATAKSGAYADLDPVEAQRRLARSESYDASVNISGAMSNYNDDFQWASFSQTFAKDGLRGRQASGFYRGPDSIVKAENMAWGPPRSPRTTIPIHIRTQPVVLVAPDGKSAKVRTRLFQMLASFNRAGMFSGGGMYPADVTVLEDGAWRMSNVAIEEFYWQADSWENGWARAKELDSSRTTQPPPTKMFLEYPPDVAYRDMGLKELGFAGGTGNVILWPEIKPMWFAYRNPVSGRIPYYYCPDERTCFKDERMKITGREMWAIQ